jgi:flagellar motor switch protein FliM
VGERLARALRTTGGSWFGAVPNVKVRGLELVRADGLMGALNPSHTLAVFRLAPLRGHGLLVVPSSLLAALIQVSFGGSPARTTPLPDRERSAIELRIVERVATRILHDFEEAWAPFEALTTTPVRIETNPQRAQVATAQDLLLQIDVQIEIPAGEAVVLTIVVPNGSLDPLQEKLAGATSDDDAAPSVDPEWTARLRRALVAAEVEVSAELGSSEVPLNRVLAFKAGDLVPLTTGRDGPVVVRVEGCERFVGAPGVAGGHNAVRITARG